MTSEQKSLCEHCVRVMRMAFNHIPKDGDQYQQYLSNSLEWAMRDMNKMLNGADNDGASRTIPASR